MRILLDEYVDWRLGREIAGHDVRTARQMGWSVLANGELLALAAKDFEVFLTVDRNLLFQQHVPALGIAVVVMRAPTNRLVDLRLLIPALLDVLRSAPAGTVTRRLTVLPISNHRTPPSTTMKLHRIALLMATALLGWQLAAHAADDKLLAAARAAEPAVIESLREMVAIESGSQDAAGLKAMTDYTEARLRALGASTERITAGIGPGEMVKGSFTGTGKKKFMLIAHLDTVYPKGILATEPYRRDGNKLYGPGIADDKGGIAVVLHSLAILRDAGWRDYAKLTVLFNPDEEVGSAGSGETLAKLGEGHDVVLSFEPTAAKAVAQAEGVLLMAAGTAQARMTVKGRASHAGAAPDQGRNALIELAWQLLQTQDVAKGIAGAQLNWTTIGPLTTRNQIPERAEAGADVRLLAPDAADKLLAALRAKVAESKRVPDTETTVELDIGRPPYVAGPRGMALAQKAQAIYAELDGRKLLLHPRSGGGTDAGYAQRSGKPAVFESLGLAGWGYHAKNEYIEIDSIVPRLYLTTRLLGDLAKE